MQQPRMIRALIISVLALLIGISSLSVKTASYNVEVARPQNQITSLSASEFARLVREFSEDGGYFWSENFISNETSYLHILGKLREMASPGGAYIGVGPEQNFTYIAKLRPQIAFIVDIRRQAMIQHLFFKALFHLSRSRSQFLSLLLSKPLLGKGAPAPGASLDEMLGYFSKTATDGRAYTANLADVRKVIRDEFQLVLSSPEQASLEHVYTSFREDGLDISFRLDNGGGGLFGYFPTLRELLKETDLNGKPGNFLASTEDYDFMRAMHEKNLIIPIVGDFAGGRALPAVGDYLRKHGYTITVFYLSNVEQYLFEDGSFPGFVANVKKLPIAEKSLFIRTVFDIRRPHPAQIPGHHVTTLLQQIPIFLNDYGEGRYPDYWTLVTTHFVATEKSKL
jgi:hypothetical protein